MRITLLALTLGGVLASAAWSANPPANAAFTTCLKKHGVTLGKTTNQKTIQAAFVACRASAPGGGRGFQLTKAQRTAFAKYRACLAKHGVKISFQPGRRGSGRPPTGARPKVSAKVAAAQKACASLRPKFRRRPPGAPA